MDMIYTDASFKPVGVLSDVSVDAAIGEDENDFEVVVSSDGVPTVSSMFEIIDEDIPDTDMFTNKYISTDGFINDRSSSFHGLQMYFVHVSKHTDFVLSVNTASKTVTVAGTNDPECKHLSPCEVLYIRSYSEDDIEFNSGNYGTIIIGMLDLTETPSKLHIRTSDAARSYVTNELPQIASGSLIYEHGTDVGGIVDTVTYDSTGDAPVIRYSGRTWTGIMASSITQPDDGQDHLVLSGDLNECIGVLIERAGLSDVFSAPSAPSGITLTNYEVARYVSLYEAITTACWKSGKRLQVTRVDGVTMLTPVDATSWTNNDGHVDARMRIESERRPTNHLVLLGSGELKDRIVSHVYADKNGVISQTQSLFGTDEVCEVYEMSSESDVEKLIEEGVEKLRDMQLSQSVSMTLPDGGGYEIGDSVTCIATEVGMSATAMVTKKIITVSDGVVRVSYETGTPTSAKMR